MTRHFRAVNDEPTALFEREDSGYRPTRLSRSPWSTDALHGGPPAALLAREIERFGEGERFRVVRVTVELLRPVPFERLEISAHLRRPGRNVQLIEATLSSPEHDVARATGLRIRRGDISLPDEIRNEVSPHPGPEEGQPPTHRSGPFHPGFHSEGVEHRFIRGSFDTPGPAVDWIRVKYPLLEGEPLSPLCRACAAADFGNGISGLLPGTHTYINPDLTVYLDRYPEGEWICLDSVTRIRADGMGLAESRLSDQRGRIGCSMQSLIVSERGD
ncbi:MAG: thioesterase family protein [Gemmatimonadota bacterium]